LQNARKLNEGDYLASVGGYRDGIVLDIFEIIRTTDTLAYFLHNMSYRAVSRKIDSKVFSPRGSELRLTLATEELAEKHRHRQATKEFGRILALISNKVDTVGLYAYSVDEIQTIIDAVTKLEELLDAEGTRRLEKRGETPQEDA